MEMDKIAKRKTRMEAFCLEGVARHIKSNVTWETLVFPKYLMTSLRCVCNQIKGNRWKSKGLRMLFTGPSGISKTLAAEVLANELQLDLYRIDLSKVVSKYIGETEKNLRQVFDAAEDGGVILLFDEADALFGKRSEVKDSHDRYANIEVDYLLQQMEQFDGIAVLASNRHDSIDKAFARRFYYVLEFPSMD